MMALSRWIAKTLVAVPVGADTASRLRDALIPAIELLRVGVSTDPEAHYGPVVTAGHKVKIEGWIGRAEAEGAEIVVDGRGFSLQGHENGYFLGPTLIDRVTPKMDSYRQEIFGPVLQIVRVRDFEEALRLRDSGTATEVVVATIAPANAQPHLRNGLAMGANRAIHVVADEEIQPLTAARTFLKLIEKEQPDLVILGKQAIDDDANQTGQMLATLWGRPQATFASKLEIADGKATVTREVDAGLETLEVDLPAVVTAMAVSTQNQSRR